MRTLVVVVLVIVGIVAATGLYLAATTPDQPAMLRAPLNERQRSLLGHVPPSAEAFAYVPAAAAMHARVHQNGITRDAAASWFDEHEAPDPWMLGRADVVVWKDGRTTAFAVRLDKVRALLVRAWLLVSSNAAVRWEGTTLLMHAAADAAPSTDLDELLSLANGLPEANALLFQREGGRGAYPPIGRPAVSSVALSSGDIIIVSRARTSQPPSASPSTGRFPSDAMVAATFSAPPRILGDLSRLLGMRFEGLIDRGGALSIYDVDTGTLLPRPKGVLVFPATEEARRQVGDLTSVISLVGEVKDTGSEIVVSFDRESMGRYAAGSLTPGRWQATEWALRLDPQRLVPVLRRVGDSAGLQLMAPRTHRAARDLRSWIDALEKARSIEAAASVTGGVEELRVRIAAK
jgi:hypothetical protein